MFLELHVIETEIRLSRAFQEKRRNERPIKLDTP